MYLIDLDTVLSILAYLIITKMFTPIFKVLIRSLSERENRQVKFRFFDLWIKFGKIIVKV